MLKRLGLRPIARRVRIDAAKLDVLDSGGDEREWARYALELDRLVGFRP